MHVAPSVAGRCAACCTKVYLVRGRGRARVRSRLRVVG